MTVYPRLGPPWPRMAVPFVLLVVALTGCQARPAAGEGPDKPLDPALFKRDQPALGRVMEWDGRVVVKADRLYTLDLDRASAKPLELPGTKEVLGVASGGPGKEFALCGAEGGPRLLVKQKDTWAEQEVPEEVRKAATGVRLVADPGSVVLLAKAKAYRLAGGKWEAVPLKARPKHVWSEGEARHALLVGEKVYLGYDRGE